MSDRPLRVHALIDSLGWGGAEALLTDFAVGAREVDMDVTVGYMHDVSGSPAAERLRAHGVQPVRVPIASLLGPRDVKAVRAHVAASGADVLHTHLLYSDILGGRAARALRMPAVSTIHLTEWERGLREGTKLVIGAHVRRRAMARVLTVSEETRRRYLAARRDTPERVITVRNGIVGRAFPGAGAAVREELGLAPEALVVAMLGVLRPGKGHEVMLEALRRLARTRPNLRLLLVGDGPSRTKVEEMARATPGVVLAGYREDAMAVLDAVDVLAQPSEFDAFPTSVLEAMAASVPVVATAVGGIPEMVGDGETGVLVSAPADPATLARALARLLDDPPMRRRAGAAARTRFEAEFSAVRWAERLRAIYELARRERGAGQLASGSPGHS